MPCAGTGERTARRLQIVPHLGRIRLRDLTKSQVDKWLKNLENSTYKTGTRTKGYSANTLRLCRVVLGIAIKWSIAERVVDKNVAKEARTPGGRIRAEKHAMTKEEVKQVIQRTMRDNLGALWALMVTTGLRWGEALGLRWQDYDGETITVTSQLKLKGGHATRGELKTYRSKRRLGLPQFPIAELESHRARQAQLAVGENRELPELIFTTSNGTKVRPDNLHKRFVVACEKAGLGPHGDGEHWPVHGPRHTAASQLLNDRVPMQIVSWTRGHSSMT